MPFNTRVDLKNSFRMALVIIMGITSSVSIAMDNAEIPDSDLIEKLIDSELSAIPGSKITHLRGERSSLGSEGESEDYFGASVDISGDTMAVSVSRERSVYIYERSGDTWSIVTKLVSPEATSTSQFGSRIALDNDTLLVGGSSEYDQIGKVYVFQKQGDTWTQQAPLPVSDSLLGIGFGSSIVLDGDLAAVGAGSATGSIPGRAYVFRREGNSWFQQARIDSPDSNLAFFARTLALDGTTLLIAASDEDTSRGAVYAYSWNGSFWHLDQRIIASDREEFDYFGTSVAIDQGLLVIGAHADDVGEFWDQGSAYVFRREGTLWTQQSKLVAIDGGPRDRFGLAVSVDAEQVVVHAEVHTQGGAIRQGAAYVFSNTSGVWQQLQKLHGSTEDHNDYFALSIAVDDRFMALGASGESVGPNNDQGAVYLFARDGATWRFHERLDTGNGARDAFFGASIAVNSGTAVIGATSSESDPDTLRAGVHVFTRDDETWTETAKLNASDRRRFDGFGEAVALDGDLAFVGAPQALDSRGLPSGAVYVFHWNQTSWIQTAKLTAPDGNEGDTFGAFLAVEGDTLVVGSPRNRGSGTLDGAAYVYQNSEAGWLLDTKLIPSQGNGYSKFGAAVAISDQRILVGAPSTAVEGRHAQGVAYLFNRAGSIWRESLVLSAREGIAESAFGTSVALGADFAFISAIGEVSGEPATRGAIYSFASAGSEWIQLDRFFAPNDDGTAVFGYGIALSGNNLVAISQAPLQHHALWAQAKTYSYARHGRDWRFRDELTVFVPGSYGYYRPSVALDGDGNQFLGLMGAAGDLPFGNMNEGVVVVAPFSEVVFCDGFD